MQEMSKEDRLKLDSFARDLSLPGMAPSSRSVVVATVGSGHSQAIPYMGVLKAYHIDAEDVRRVYLACIPRLT
jgi:hypothetical protein